VRISGRTAFEIMENHISFLLGEILVTNGLPEISGWI
jgi:hypothetical protein